MDMRSHFLAMADALSECNRLETEMARARLAMMEHLAAVAEKMLASVDGNALDPCRHSEDFASVSWYGRLFTFTASQAAAMRMLWKAWRNGTPALRQETILEAIGCESNRLTDVFRKHPAWGVMVVAGETRGTFQLVAIEEGQADGEPRSSQAESTAAEPCRCTADHTPRTPRIAVGG